MVFLIPILTSVKRNSIWITATQLIVCHFTNPRNCLIALRMKKKDWFLISDSRLHQSRASLGTLGYLHCPFANVCISFALSFLGDLVSCFKKMSHNNCADAYHFAGIPWVHFSSVPLSPSLSFELCDFIFKRARQTLYIAVSFSVAHSSQVLLSFVYSDSTLYSIRSTSLKCLNL